MGTFEDLAVEAAFPEFTIQLPRIGESGYKAVYRATERSGDVVALKILKEQVPAASPDDEPIQENPTHARFNREIEAMRAISHPNIISVYSPPEVRVIQEGAYWWYTEKFCEKGTLSDAMESGAQGEVPARQVFGEMLDALDHLWGVHRMIHRDIKPDNIGIGIDGEFILLDLGIAVDLNLERITSTSAPSPISTPWAAPEQLSYGRVDTLDNRTDLFQLGVVVFQVLTGRHPFYEGMSSVSDPFRLIDSFDPAVMRDFTSDDALCESIHRCLRLSQNARPRNASLAKRILNGA